MVKFDIFILILVKNSLNGGLGVYFVLIWGNNVGWF